MSTTPNDKIGTPTRIHQDDRRVSFAPLVGTTPSTNGVMMVSFPMPVARFRFINLETTGTDLLVCGIMSAAPEFTVTDSSGTGTLAASMDLCKLAYGHTSDWYEMPFGGLTTSAKLLVHGTTDAGVAGQVLDFQIDVATLKEE